MFAVEDMMRRMVYTITTLLLAGLLANHAVAEIPGLCNSGQTAGTLSGCTGVLVTPNPPGGGPKRDGNWKIAYPYPSVAATPCLLDGFIPAWVDTPLPTWLPNSVSTVSEWTTPYDGEGNYAQGDYVYRVALHVPAALPSGVVPMSLTINGQSSVDNSVKSVWLESPARTGQCALVTGPPPTNGFQEWGSFSFTNSQPLTPGAYAYLYFVVNNARSNGNPNATGFRVEFFSSSAFH